MAQSKYRRVWKAREETLKDETEIRVKTTGSVSAYVSRALLLFGEMEKSAVTITAVGLALTKAVTTAEIVKRRIKGLHQLMTLKTQELVDEYEALEEGLDNVKDPRVLPHVSILLSKEQLDATAAGYQAPLDEALVQEKDAATLVRKGQGKGKDERKGKGKGKGKGKDTRPRYEQGKGKSKGYSNPYGNFDRSYGVGYGGGYNSGYGGGYETKGGGGGYGYGKGYGKGKDYSKGADYGKGKDYGKRDYSDWSYSRPSRPKGKGKAVSMY